MKKINIAELLKDCPKGMELDYALFEDTIFIGVEEDKNYPILIKLKDGSRKRLTKYGCHSNADYAKCVIFPKGKTTWEGFVPFVKGDIIYTDGFVAILYNITESGTLWYYCYYSISGNCCKIKTDFGIGNVKDNELRLATEEEKQKLFDAIKANGYKWNPETKAVEKLPRFKVGDRIKSIYNGFQYDIKELTNTHYTLVEVEEKFKYTEPIGEDENWELVPNKFDITTLVPFESRVLVREDKTDVWQPTFYGFFHQKNKRFYTTSSTWRMCIPYNEDTKHLTGTTNDCDDFYKTWEK